MAKRDSFGKSSLQRGQTIFAKRFQKFQQSRKTSLIDGQVRSNQSSQSPSSQHHTISHRHARANPDVRKSPDRYKSLLVTNSS